MACTKNVPDSSWWGAGGQDNFSQFQILKIDLKTKNDNNKKKKLTTQF